MGMINDAFHESATELLDELSAVLVRGSSIVAFGQGIGPITLPDLKARARAVFPKLKFIALRESIWGLPFLKSLGVSPERIVVTGDDAIECAYRKRNRSLGYKIGVNVRLARYSTSDESFIPRLRSAIILASQQAHASLVPVPISFSAESSDLRATQDLLEGLELPVGRTADNLDDLLAAIATCRVVITGSYHAGVFALAQGIPVVALVQSSYYEQKFTGLKDQFGEGCAIIDLRSPVCSDDIAQMICSAWKSAEFVREPLLKSAAMQIESSRAAYSTVYRMFSGEPDSACQSATVQYSSG
jgi:colanic acid/amylovoran biosynthesis protein